MWFENPTAVIAVVVICVSLCVSIYYLIKTIFESVK